MPTEAWTLEGVTLDLDGRVLLADVSVAIPLAEVTAIVGPSGAGKSTLLRALAKQIRPTVGQVGGELSNGHYPIHGQAWVSQTGAARLAEIDQLLDQSPAALLLDEPTKAIAPETTAAIHNQLFAAANRGMTVVLVTHEHRWVQRSLTRALLVNGGLCWSTSVKDIDFLRIQHATMERLRTNDPVTE